jgi:hypothetical protein
MPYQLIIRQEAHHDANEAYTYYEEKSPGLGELFLQELTQRYNEIREHPEFYGFIDEQKIIRDVKLRHFPYLVVYEIRDDNVIVYSVFNGYKNPNKKVPK